MEEGSSQGSPPVADGDSAFSHEKTRITKFKSGRFNEKHRQTKPKLETTQDMEAILRDIQSKCTAAAIRQEELFAYLKVFQKELERMSPAFTDHSLLQSRKNTDEQKVSNQGTGEISDNDGMLRLPLKMSRDIASDGQDAGQVSKASTGVPPSVVGFAGPAEIALEDESEEVALQGQSPKSARTTVRSPSHRARSLLPGLPWTSAFAHHHHKKSQISKSPWQDRSFKYALSWLLKRKEFELAIAFAILCNALIMAWETQYVGLEVGYKLQYPGRSTPADDVWSGAETTFLLLNWVFGIVFLIEFLVKLVVFRCQFFTKIWNILDFGCVLAFLFDKIVAGDAGFNPQLLRCLRLFRLFRMVRLIRWLEKLESLYVMTTAIAGMSRVLGWAIALLSVMLLTCDLFLVQVLHATYFSNADTASLTAEELARHQEMYAHFGTVTRCMLSMFEITLGNWPPIARLLQEEVSEWLTVVCIVHKVTIGFAVVGVINGVILQETFKVAQTDDIIMLRQKKKAENILRAKLGHLFETLDSNHDDHVDFTEFKKICNDANIKTWLSSLEIETDDLQMLFKLCDLDQNGLLSKEELLSTMPRIKGAARSIDVLAMREWVAAQTGQKKIGLTRTL